MNKSSDSNFVFSGLHENRDITKYKTKPAQNINQNETKTLPPDFQSPKPGSQDGSFSIFDADLVTPRTFRPVEATFEFFIAKET